MNPMATELRKTGTSVGDDEAGIELLTEKVKQRVIERTNELRVANEELRREITERKQAEEKVKQSESQLAEAQHLAHVGSWDWDLRNNAVTWSDELYRIFGFQPGEIDVAHEAKGPTTLSPKRRWLNRVIRRSYASDRGGSLQPSRTPLGMTCSGLANQGHGRPRRENSNRINSQFHS